MKHALRAFFPLAAAAALAAGLLSAYAADLPEAPPPATGLGVTRVSISAEGQSLSNVLSDLSTQSKIRFSVESGDGQTPVTLHADARPLWETLMAALYPVNKDGTFTFQVDDGSSYGSTRFSGKTYVAGPFLVLATRIVHQADFRRPDDAIEQFYVEIKVLVDPALQGIYAQGDNLPAKALDDNGASLVPPAPFPERSVPLGFSNRFMGPGTPVPTRIMLARPAAPARLGTRLASLQGEIPVTVATQIEKIELDVPGKADRVFDGIKCAFECKVQTSGSIEVSAHFDRPDGISDQQWNDIDKRLFVTRLQVLDDSDVPFPAPGGSGASYGPKVRSMYQSFSQDRAGAGRRGGAAPAVGAAHKAVVTVITQAKTVNVPYRFGDLPLP